MMELLEAGAEVMAGQFWPLQTVTVWVEAPLPLFMLAVGLAQAVQMVVVRAVPVADFGLISFCIQYLDGLTYRAGVNGGSNRNNGSTSSGEDSGSGGGVRAVSASNRSSRNDSGSGADVGGLADRDNLSDDSAFTVSERAVGDSRSTAVDGDNIGGVDGRGSNTASRDGDLTIASSAIASTIAVSAGDALSELGALLSVGSLDIAEESA